MADVEERLDALERLCDVLRSALAAISNQLPLQAERLQQQATAQLVIEERTAMLAAQAAQHADLLSGLQSTLSAAEAVVVAHGEEMTRMRTALTRLQRQLELDAEEARRMGAALMETIGKVEAAPSSAD